MRRRAAPLLGAHMSIAGGLPNAPRRGQEVGCQTIQLFTKSNNQWHARPLTAEEITQFRQGRAAANLSPLLAHTCYLINLASPDPALIRKSRAAFAEEMRRAEVLGIEYLVTHPGAHMGAGEKAGLRQVAESVGLLLEATLGGSVQILLEVTAGQGTSLGWRFEQIAEVLTLLRGAPRVGVCLDTCHLFAAGYDIRTEAGYLRTMEECGTILGWDRVKALHLNDSKKDRGCRVDRHEHIGRGYIGRAGFSHILHDPHLRGLPMILETPKGEEPVTADRRNLALLRRLASAPR